jgi:dolichol-phosphate mannosyltransferase
MLEVAVVIPTLNEVENVPVLVNRLVSTLSGIEWEAIFVDDDSRDGTAELLREISLHNPRVRVIQRIGRTGLSSADIEGMMATAAPYIAVMDADLQHDETVLPQMVERLRTTTADVVVASRHTAGGGMGNFTARRRLLSDAGAYISRVVCRCEVTDPMSGYFLIRREVFHRTVRRLSGTGFKILVDILASSPKPLQVVEVPYTFRERIHGASKLDINIGLEYALLIMEKLFGNNIPVRFILFASVGALGVICHLAELWLLYRVAGMTFLVAQAVATVIAMTVNFFLNNQFTYRDLRLRGKRLLPGLLTFYLACSVGALVNIALATYCLERGLPWYLASTFGLVAGSVWNYSLTSVITWRKLRRRSGEPADARLPASTAGDAEHEVVL